MAYSESLTIVGTTGKGKLHRSPYAGRLDTSCSQRTDVTVVRTVELSVERADLPANLPAAMTADELERACSRCFPSSRERLAALQRTRTH